MAESVGTVHLSISADLTTLEARLKQRFAVLGKQLGQQLGQDLGREATRGIETSMAAVSRTAFVPLEQAAKQAGKKISDNLDVTVKTDKAKAQLAALAAQQRVVELQVEANTRKAETRLAQFDAEENQLRIDVDAKVDGAQAKLDALLDRRKTFEIEVEAQTLRAKVQLDSIDNRRKVVYEADAKTDGAKAKLDALSGSIGGVTSGFSTIGLAGVAGMSTIIPVAAAATGAVLALGVAVAGVGAAFGVAGLAFSGVGTALTALNNQQSKAGEAAGSAASSALSLANAQDSLKSALQGVTDAQFQAGQATTQAAQQTVDAEKALQAAQQDALQTQKDLNAAREQAVRDLEDIANRASDAALNQRQASFDLADAQDAYNKVVADPRATQAQKDRAKLTLDQATQRKKEADEEAKRSAADAAAAKKAGVEGSAAVTQAKQREKSAVDKVQQAELDVAKARKNEAEVARQNAESIAKAEQGVVQAQRGIQAALLATQQVGAATTNAVNEAFGDLSPAGVHFAKFIFGLKDQLDVLKAAAQSALLPPLERAIRLLLPYLPQVRAFVSNVGAAMGDVAIKIAKLFTSKDWKDFFKILAQDTPGILRDLGDGFVAIGKVIARVFTAAAPYAKVLVGNIVDFFKSIDTATSGSGGKSKLASFFSGMMPVLGAAWNVVKSIANVLKAVITGGTGTSGGAANTLNSLADAINRLATYLAQHPEVIARLGQIAAGMLALKAASPAISTVGSIGQAVGGLAQVLKLVAWGAVFGAISTGIEAVAAAIGIAVGPFLLIVAAIAAIAAGLYLLYTKCQWFHDTVNTIISAIGGFFVWLWKVAIKPALEAVAAIFWWLYNNVIKPVWTLIWTAVQVGWGIIEVIFGLIEIAVKAQLMVWSWLYNNVIKPVWGWISDHISTVWNKDIKPIFDAVGAYIQKNVAPKFQTAINALSTIWDALKETFKAPIRFFIQTVLDDGLFAAYNKLAKFFHITPDNVHVTVPSLLLPGNGGSSRSSAPTPAGNSKAFATGGPVFGAGTETSDSIPALLSNNEHVWTSREVQAAGGHSAVEALRTLVLRQAGAPRFATGGGVFSWLGGAWDKTKAIGGAIKDALTDPIGTLSKVANAALGGLPGGKDGLLGKAVTGVTNKIAGGVGAFVKSLLGLGGGGSTPGRMIGGGNVANQAIGQAMAAARGWVGDQWLSLKSLWNGESGWNDQALNASSGAFGIPQSLPASKMASAGPDWRTNPATQIRWGLDYIASVYGNPSNTYAKWLSRSPHWYDEGGWLKPGSTLVQNDTGKPEAVFSPSQWATLAGNLGRADGGADYSRNNQVDIHTYGDPEAIAKAMAAELDRMDLLDAITL